MAVEDLAAFYACPISTKGDHHLWPNEYMLAALLGISLTEAKALTPSLLSGLIGAEGNLNGVLPKAKANPPGV